MNDRISIRQYAVSVAVQVMGVGTPDKDVISKAKEIEAYIVGGADIPEVGKSDTEALIGSIGGMVTAMSAQEKKK